MQVQGIACLVVQGLVSLLPIVAVEWTVGSVNVVQGDAKLLSQHCQGVTVDAGNDATAQIHSALETMGLPQCLMTVKRKVQWLLFMQILYIYVQH